VVPAVEVVLAESQADGLMLICGYEPYYCSASVIRAIMVVMYSVEQVF
jgi:hypothetical protein